MFNENPEKYLYRRQYLLGPRLSNEFRNWKQIQVTADYYLTFHPDLPMTKVSNEFNTILLLGYLIDPYNPSFNDSQIMQNILNKSQNADDVFFNLADKCGRYVVILNFNGIFRIFSDACGLRQVFYHIDEQNQVWCSSQPHIIAKQLNIKINEDIKNDLYQTQLFKSTEHWYPGNLTLFDGIFHLTPNHYFDIKLRKSFRYWPWERLNPLSISECIPKVTKLLKGIIEGASFRYNLAFAISSGLDSRTLFSVTRKVANEIHYFTQSHGASQEVNPDVLIPSKMLKELGLKHSVLSISNYIDKNFYEILKRNVFTARRVKGLNAYSIFDYFKVEQKEIVVLYGNCSEITKRDRFRFPKTPRSFLTGKALAAMAKMSHSAIAVKQFTNWLISAKKLTAYNIDIMDMMHWEQRVGNWGAMTFAEYEMVYESLCPYSCRRYIEYMLSVPFKYRTQPEYKLHHEIISANWPEVLEYEINPEKNKIKKKVENFLYRTGVYDYLKLVFLMTYKQFK